MTIPTTQYKGHELHAYFQQIFPVYRDPYAAGPRRYSAIVGISASPPGDEVTRRYAIPFIGDNPTLVADAIALAMQYGRDVIDGKVQAKPL